MPEWSNGTVLKTVVAQVTQGSNPCLSAIFFSQDIVSHTVSVEKKNIVG